MNNSEKLLVTLDGGVKRITFNNPGRRNAVDFGMFAAFAEAIAESAVDASRVIVITGAGEAFCSGLDLASISASELAALDVAAKVRELINPPILQMRALRKPVVARVQGPAVGIGFSYVLASDVCVASHDATFSQSFVRVGLMPDGGSTHFLHALVGRAKAFELMTTGATLSADEALRLGLVNRVVAREELDAAVDDLAARLAAAPQPSLARIKAALSRAEQASLAAALDFEAEGQAECFASADFREGVTAFMQKRAPEFGKGNK
ncbi:MAG: 2-(1,2-epoxy,2-dihydrophenyl)acetyl-CoA isomerase [Acidobacteriota bacterium]|jgi:2-(1,2-epoxy-1,2-dihydrophenyl)acetyl-CoA isomerase|nr:2-(1,2-epoxy,2-dihydrophenyl)acetyl-CoA isomerase [Acidobacteriota bacterium]